MPFGYHGKILHVNLTLQEITVEKPEEQFYRVYPGGGALGAYYLLKDHAYRVDPLEPGNTLVFAPGVVTGAPISGLSRFTVTARSPLTGGIGDGQAGGSWGVALKKCGYDAIVIRGKALRPVYLAIVDGNLQIREAGHLWGKTAPEAEKIIRQEINDSKAAVALIGPGGENMVRYACIVSGLNHFNGRTGMGAVMGSKNLKAIALSPSLKLEFADPAGVKVLAKKGAQRARENDGAQFLGTCGTAGATAIQNSGGGLPTRNFVGGFFPGVDKTFEEELNKRTGASETCFGCVIHCKKKVTAAYGKYSGLPEYESLAALGAYTGISDLDILLEANEKCTGYTLDTISTGATIALAMECFERGIITKEELGGIEARFGSGEALLQLIDAVAYRKGIGDLLAEGSKRAAESWGPEVEKLAVHVKGLEVPAHLPQLKNALALAYAANPFGADHVSSEHDGIFASDLSQSREILRGLGLYETRPTQSLDFEKVRFFSLTHRYYSILDTFNLCSFCFGLGWIYKAADIVEAVRSVTGWETNFFELMLTGERRINMQRVFNLRAGLTKEDDTLPERLFLPLKGGPSDGTVLSREALTAGIRDYYRLAGWDEDSGYPSAEKLRELSLGWLLP